MEPAGFGLATLILLTYSVNAVLKRAAPARKGFPTCQQCGRIGTRVTNLGPDLPFEIGVYLSKYGLPEKVVSRYLCPRGCSEMWYVPRLGDAERGVFVSNRLN